LIKRDADIDERVAGARRGRNRAWSKAITAIACTAAAALYGPSVAAGADTAPSAPSAPNKVIAIPNLQSKACRSDGTGTICENEVISALDHARAVLGFGPYRLPQDFLQLPVASQFLVLANLDRLAYRELPIVGVNRTLNEKATEAAVSGTAPKSPGVVHGVIVDGFGSINLSGQIPNPLVAYYVWMYDDGYGGPNAGCKRPAAPGCWSHRNLLLALVKNLQISMGGFGGLVPSGAIGAGIAIATTQPQTRIPYLATWAALRHQGAGAHRYALGTLPHLPATPSRVQSKSGGGSLTITWREPATPATTGFEIVYAPVGGGSPKIVEIPSPSTSYVVSGLDPGTRYRFALAALGADGTSAFVIMNVTAQ